MDRQRLEDMIRFELNRSFRVELSKELREQIAAVLARELKDEMEDPAYD